MKMARVPIGLELYSVREDLARDPKGTLKRVAEMGYDGVEFAGFPLPADELRGILDELGIVCCSSHTPLDHLLGAKLEETVAFNRTLGNKMLICPWIGEPYYGSRAGWLQAAELFNGIADRLAPHGMVTGYHNHDAEFKAEYDGETPWDIFFSHTKKEVVMQLDTGNALHGGGLSAPILRKFPGRARSVHLKPYSVTAAKAGPNAGFAPLIGEDEIPWAEIFELCETIGGTEWYVVEYECDAYPALDAVERCLKALRAMGK
jgi:sugar phosphate isomerase/epimerase